MIQKTKIFFTCGFFLIGLDVRAGHSAWSTDAFTDGERSSPCKKVSSLVSSTASFLWDSSSTYVARKSRALAVWVSDFRGRHPIIGHAPSYDSGDEDSHNKDE